MTTRNDKKEKLKTLTIRVKPSWEARLDRWIARQRIVTTRTFAIILAVNEFLDAEEAKEAAISQGAAPSAGFEQGKSCTEDVTD
jgi:predicted transcriptional regulator